MVFAALHIGWRRGRRFLLAAACRLMAACACRVACCLLQGTPLAAKMLYAALFMGYCYQGPPFRCAAAA